jgi:translation initiation factor IF-1
VREEPEVEMTGTVREQLPNALYRVELQNEGRREVVAHVGGQAPLLRLRPGDGVVVALLPYDQGRGRILRRRG